MKLQNQTKLTNQE